MTRLLQFRNIEKEPREGQAESVAAFAASTSTCAMGEHVMVAEESDRIFAMAMALVGLRWLGMTISNPDVVAKSYPDSWHNLQQLLVV